MAEKPESRHVPALDGLRGLAILAVLLYHFGVVLEGGPAAPANRLFALGLHGVDLFFALSGFLITGILLSSRDRPGYFGTFYARRSLRIFPLYYAYLALVFWAIRPLFRLRYGEDVLAGVDPWWYVFYASNLKPGHGIEDPYLGPLWSLAVEEQFYLIWPLVLYLCPPRRLAPLCVALAAAALAVRVALVARGYGEWTPYTLAPARLDGLALGALGAVLIRDPGRREGRRAACPTIIAASLAGAVVVSRLGGGFEKTRPLTITLGWSLVAIGSAALVFWASASRGRVAGVLAWRPLMALGAYSYGLYVLHFLPFLFYLRYLAHRVAAIGAGPWKLLAIQLAALAGLFLASLGLAFASRKLIEDPFLKLKAFFPSRPAAEAVAVQPGPAAFEA